MKNSDVKLFWTFLGFVILVWQLFQPTIERVVIGTLFFVIGCLQDGDTK